MSQRIFAKVPLREKCPYSELFWSAFSRIRTEYGEIWIISPHSVQMRENTGQNNSEYGHFLPRAPFLFPLEIQKSFRFSDFLMGDNKETAWNELTLKIYVLFVWIIAKLLIMLGKFNENLERFFSSSCFLG